MAPAKKCPISKPPQFRNRIFRHRSSEARARQILATNFNRFFELFELVLNQSDAVYSEEEFSAVIDQLRELVTIWSNALVYRNWHPYQRR